MSRKNRGDSTEDRLLTAPGSPMRHDILKVMMGKEEISPQQIANCLREPLANVSYHVRILAECEAIVLVRGEPVRGSWKHFYRIAFEDLWAYEALGLAPPTPER